MSGTVSLERKGIVYLRGNNVGMNNAPHVSAWQTGRCSKRNNIAVAVHIIYTTQYAVQGLVTKLESVVLVFVVFQ